MSKYIYPSTLLCDFYKVGHYAQYPDNTQYVYSTFTPRTSRLSGINSVVNFGLQAFVKKFLIGYFNENFFNRTKDEVIGEYKRVLKYTLGVEELFVGHIVELHDLGYLPLKVRSVKEGTVTPIKVPVVTVENTDPRFFWLTNYIETLISCELWQSYTSATVAHEYKRILTKYAELTGADMGNVQFQAHDFSMRGMSSLESAKLSGAGHLLSFVGTDTIPAIMFHEEFYNANVEKELIGTSVNATEHSVMCAGSQEDEFGTYRRLIEEVYPYGFVSIVSDTWDFWHVVGDTLPKLKNLIMARDGRVVIRPDSGDPVKIICGDPEAEDILVRKGLIECLWDTFGGTLTDTGFKVLDTHIGAIYGDSITLQRAETICEQLKSKGFASTNIVFGVGSFTYQYNTRDTFGFAMKATHVVINSKERNILKDPKTDSGMKKSQTGRVVVHKNEDGNIVYTDGLNRYQQTWFENVDLLEDVFIDGMLVRDQSLAEIRKILAEQ